jgi:hypothetical protein
LVPSAISLWLFVEAVHLGESSGLETAPGRLGLFVILQFISPVEHLPAPFADAGASTTVIPGACVLPF